MAKKTPPPRKPRPKRPKQPFFEGMEPPSFPPLDDAIEQYVEARDARMEALKEEVLAKAALITLMKDLGQVAYTTPDGYTATLESTSDLKVRRRKQEAEANGEES